MCFGYVFNLGWCLLQIHALTELCLFTEAVKEAVQLTQGIGVCLPNGYYIAKDSLQVWIHINTHTTFSLFAVFSLTDGLTT